MRGEKWCRKLWEALKYFKRNWDSGRQGRRRQDPRILRNVLPMTLQQLKRQICRAMCFLQMLIVLMLFVLRLFIGFLCCLIHRTQLPEGSYIWPAFGSAENISRPWLLRICQSGDNALNSCICSQILGRRRMEFMIWGESQYGMQIGCFLPEENITFNNSLVFLQQQKIRNAAPATLSRSRIQTWGHTAGRQRGTRWCRSCTSTEKGIIWAN